MAGVSRRIASADHWRTTSLTVGLPFGYLARDLTSTTERRGAIMAGGSRQIFISYARNDAERVDRLVEGLRQLRYDAWVDEELTGGQAWWETVLAQIRASSAVLVALSPAALESVAVRREYEYADAVRRPLLPVVVDRVRLETLPALLAPLQVVDYRQPDTKSAFALAAAVAALPAPQAPPQPLPESPPIPISYLSGLKERAQADTLSMDEQLALIARLKVALGRARDREVAEAVLRSLQDRDDLYLVSAREIESLLSPLNRQVSASQRQEPPERARDQHPIGFHAPVIKGAGGAQSAANWKVEEVQKGRTRRRLVISRAERHEIEFFVDSSSGGLSSPELLMLDGDIIGRNDRSSWQRDWQFRILDGGKNFSAKLTAYGSRKSPTIKVFELEIDGTVIHNDRG